MKKKRRKIISVITIIGIALIGLLANSLMKKNNNDIEFPYQFEVENYNIEIEYIKFYDNYLLTKHNIRKKDGSNIEKDELNLSTVINEDIYGYIFGPQVISTKIIDDKIKEEISIDFIAAVENPLEKVKIRHGLAGKKIDGIKRVKKDGVIKLAKENYKNINKKMKIDDVNLTVMDLGNFEFGSILNIFTENTKDKNFGDFDEKYNIKLKSGDFTKVYEIKKAIGLNGDYIEDIIKWREMNKEAKVIEFFTVGLLYDINSIDFNNFEVFIVNKDTNEETRII